MQNISNQLRTSFVGLADKILMSRNILIASFMLSLCGNATHAQYRQPPYANYAGYGIQPMYGNHAVQQAYSQQAYSQQAYSQQAAMPNQAVLQQNDFHQLGFQNAGGYVQPNGLYSYPTPQNLPGYQQHYRINDYTASKSYGAYQFGIPMYADQLYRSNATQPLGGLFAKGFTRTLTLLGGFNFTNSLASPAERPNPQVGVSFFDSMFNDPDTGSAISFAFGRRHSYILRSEIEIAVRQNDLNTNGSIGVLDLNNSVVRGENSSSSDGDEMVDAYSILKNFILDFRNSSRYTPYAGFGIGWSFLDVESRQDGINDGSGAFTYQAIGGIATTLNRAVEFIVEYRFLGTSEVKLDDFGATIAYRTNNLFFGLKYEY